MFWYKQAQKKLIQDQIKNVTAARLAFAKDTDYRKVVSGLEMQLAQVDGNKDDMVRQNWKDLKMIGGF